MNIPDEIKITDYEAGNAESIFFVPICDCQIGNPAFAQEALQGYTDWILKTPGAVVALMGDMLETPISGGKTSDVFDSMNPDEAMDLAIELFTPIKDRIIAVVEGNHENRVRRTSGLHLSKQLLQALGMGKVQIRDIYDPYAIVVRVHVGKSPHSTAKNPRALCYNLFLTHGYGGSRFVGGQVNKIEYGALPIPNCDAYIFGHEHSLTYSRPDALVIPATGKHTTRMRRVCVGGGCFCAWSSFQKGRVLRLPNVGAPRLRLSGIKRDLHVSY